MGIIMSDIIYKKSHSLPKGAKPQIEITFIILFNFSDFGRMHYLL